MLAAGVLVLLFVGPNSNLPHRRPSAAVSPQTQLQQQQLTSHKQETRLDSSPAARWILMGPFEPPPRPPSIAPSGSWQRSWREPTAAASSRRSDARAMRSSEFELVERATCCLVEPFSSNSRRLVGAAKALAAKVAANALAYFRVCAAFKDALYVSPRSPRGSAASKPEARRPAC